MKSKHGSVYAFVILVVLLCLAVSSRRADQQVSLVTSNSQASNPMGLSSGQFTDSSGRSWRLNREVLQKFIEASTLQAKASFMTASTALGDNSRTVPGGPVIFMVSQPGVHISRDSVSFSPNSTLKPQLGPDPSAKYPLILPSNPPKFVDGTRWEDLKSGTDLTYPTLPARPVGSRP